MGKIETYFEQKKRDQIENPTVTKDIWDEMVSLEREVAKLRTEVNKNIADITVLKGKLGIAEI